MAKKEFSLGDSLAAALGKVSDSDHDEQIEYISLQYLVSDERNFYSMDGVEELAANIELIGLQQPLRVLKGESGFYVIVSGHRRAAALRLLAEETPEKWDRVPCIVERPGASPQLEELRLIMANADTRKMSSADVAKQAERVQQLLYELKEQGYEFPGRMRDHVAEACKISSTKLAMLKVIREKLAEPYVPLYESGKLTESSAYAIAQADARVQDRLRNYWAPTEIAEKPEWWISSKIGYMTECYNRKCKATDGLCEHAETLIDRKMRNPNRYVDCEYQKCCANCPKVGTCKTACAYVAETRAAMREAEKKEKERAKAEAAELDRQRAQQKAEERKKNTADWQRFWNAAKAAGMDEDAFMTSLCISQEWWNDTVKRNSRAELRRRIEGSWDEGVDGYGQIEDSPLVYLEDPEDYIDVANVLHCSVDYLLGRTDDPSPAAPAQQTEAAPLQFRSGTPDPQSVISSSVYWCAFSIGRDVKMMTAYWNRGLQTWETGNCVPIKYQCLGWIELPDYEHKLWKKIKTYLCDPARNPSCTKALCFERGGPCGTTDDVSCALRDLIGRPVEIVEDDFENGGDEKRKR